MLNKRYTYHLIIFFTVIFSFTALSGAEMTGFNFLRTNVGARPSAIAGAFVSINGDINSVYYNPAGISGLNSRVVSASYLNHVLDIQSGIISYGQPVKDIGVVGVGINYMDYGSFDRTNKNGEKLGTFSASSLVLSSSLARELISGLKGGLTLKYIRSVIDDYSAQAVAFDVGLIYHPNFTEGLDIGIAALHIGQATSAFIDTKEDLPTKLVAGFSKQLAHLPLMFNANVYKYVDNDVEFLVGGEFTLAEGLFLRFGYNSIGADQQVGGSYDSIAGFSAGLGFSRNDYMIDYSFSSLGQVGGLNRISFSAAF